MRLTLSALLADRSPADEIGDELRRDRVEILGGGGHPHPVDLDEQIARPPESLVDRVAPVEVGVVDLNSKRMRVRTRERVHARTRTRSFAHRG
eukprot:879576-Pleurochrysis_carterae.AAC.1